MIGSGSAEVTWTSASIRRLRLVTAAAAGHVPPVKGDQVRAKRIKFSHVRVGVQPTSAGESNVKLDLLLDSKY